MLELTKRTFDKLSAEDTTVIDFWAEWCGPCKTFSPIFSQVAETLAGTATFAKLNVDQVPSVAGDLQIMSIPTILVMRGGVEIGRIVGSRPATQLRQELESIIA